MKCHASWLLPHAANQRWCSSHRLQLDPSKTERIWFSTRCNLQKISASDRSLHINEARDIIDLQQTWLLQRCTRWTITSSACSSPSGTTRRSAPSTWSRDSHDARSSLATSGVSHYLQTPPAYAPYIHNGKAPPYLTDIATATAGIESRSSLRSASNDLYKIPQSRLQFGERRFAVAGPRAWNNLPTRPSASD